MNRKLIGSIVKKIRRMKTSRAVGCSSLEAIRCNCIARAPPFLKAHEMQNFTGMSFSEEVNCEKGEKDDAHSEMKYNASMQFVRH